MVPRARIELALVKNLSRIGSQVPKDNQLPSPEPSVQDFQALGSPLERYSVQDRKGKSSVDDGHFQIL